MVYDFQNYFERFSDSNDNYHPFKINDDFEKKTANKRHTKEMVKIPGGIFEMGFGGDSFSYDNELPEHKVYLYPYEIDNTPVSNGDFINFIEEGGYEKYEYWLSDGWDIVQEFNWNSPLYWFKR
jgi:formylglycine-generating enzyme required for sulfatase activity